MPRTNPSLSRNRDHDTERNGLTKLPTVNLSAELDDHSRRLLIKPLVTTQILRRNYSDDQSLGYQQLFYKRLSALDKLIAQSDLQCGPRVYTALVKQCCLQTGRIRRAPALIDLARSLRLAEKRLRTCLNAEMMDRLISCAILNASPSSNFPYNSAAFAPKRALQRAVLSQLKVASNGLALALEQLGLVPEL